MQSADISKLNQIIESRSGKELVIGGEYIAFMGIIIIATNAFNTYVFSDWLIWLIGMIIGWSGIMGYDYLKEKKEGKYSTRVQNEIFSIWIAVGGVAVPFVLLIFPGYFQLYDGKAIRPLIYMVLGLGIWLTGVVAKSSEFRFGALACVAGIFLSIYLNSEIQQMVIFHIVMIAGMIVPGIVSKYNEKRG